MEMYSVNFGLGQALVKAETEEDAKEYAIREWGSCHGPYRIDPATKEDEHWVTAMNGIVHQA